VKQHKTILMSLVLLSLPLLLHARLVPMWSYDELFKQSDLVVIAQPTNSVDVTDRMQKWESTFIGINTTFKIDHVVKGDLKSSDMTMLHYRMKSGELMENGPCLVSFRTQDIRYTVEDGPKVHRSGPGTYLLFLKKLDDRRYEAVTGQIDPVFSVKELTEPIEGELSQQPTRDDAHRLRQP